MKTLLVYDSAYGNTEKIARAIAGAIAPVSEVVVLRADEANPSELARVDLLIVGSPTQGVDPRRLSRIFSATFPQMPSKIWV